MSKRAGKFLSLILVLLMSTSIISMPTFAADGPGGAQVADDPYWPQSMYDHIEKTVMDNAPIVRDANGQYVYETVDGVFTYSVKLTDFPSRKSIEDVFSARPSGTGTILTRLEVDDWTWAIRAALQDVAEHGGGTVVLPRGIYTTGAIRYRGNNTRIHLEDGAEIQFIRNLQYGTNVRAEPTTMLPPVVPKDGEWDDWYPQEKTRFECRDFYGFSPLIYAYDLKNLALTGAGFGGWDAVAGDGRNGTVDGAIIPEPGKPISIINGMADSRHMRVFTATLPVYDVDNTTILVPTGTASTANIGADGKAVLTGGTSYSTWLTNLMNAWEPMDARFMPDLLPLDTPGLPDARKVVRNFRRVNQYRPTFIEPHECQNILIEGFYLRQSPFWELHPTYCQNIHVRDLHINSHGGNNDGCNPDSSQYVIIEDCLFNTGDDCIAIKCGRDNDAYQPWNMPSTHIIVRDNLMKDGHGGTVCGSEMGGGVEWVFSHRNVYASKNLFFGLRVKTNSSRGGYVRHIYMKDTEVVALMAAFATINFYYDNDSDTRVPTASDIYISNCYSTPGGFTNKPKLGLIIAKQYGNSPINGVHFKDCNFDGFHQSPGNAGNPNRPVTNLMCIAPGGIEYDNVIIDGQLYQPPQKSSDINTLIFTRSSDPSDVRIITKPEELEALILESRTAADKNWDISIVAKVDGYDYKGKHYTIGDTIENSTYTGPLGDSSFAGMEDKYNGGTLYVNRSPFIRDEDRRYPYYRANGMPAYEAFVRVNSNHSGEATAANDWGTASETFDMGPNYVIDLRMPGRVTSLGDGEYLIKLRENVNMGSTYTIRAGVFTLSKVEVVLRNALYPDDQDFVFYSAIPMITKTEIDASKKLFVVSYDRPMNPKYLAGLEELDFDLAADGSAVSIESAGAWSDDGRSISYKILDAVDPGKYYTVDAFDPTSRVLSYRGNVPVVGSAITSIAYDSRIQSLVTGYPANIPVSVTASNPDGLDIYAGLFVDGALFGNKEKVVGGAATIKAPVINSTDVYIAAWFDGDEANAVKKAIPTAGLPADIWKPIAAWSRTTSSFDISVSFALGVTVALSPSASVTVNGVAARNFWLVPGQVAYSMNILSNGPTFQDDAKVTITGIKYPELFPSYSFTFTMQIL